MSSDQVSFRGSAIPVGNQGHWGDITSSVDWCELNYMFSQYIAEFWNSTSPFSMVLVGLFGIVLHYKLLEKRFLLAFFFVSVLGVGSVLFHGSLKHETQMLDELPMLYAAFTTTYILLENKDKPVFGSWLAPSLVAWSIITSCATFFATGIWQFLMFHFSFGSAEFFSLYRIYTIYSKWQQSSNTEDEKVSSSAQLQQQLVTTGYEKSKASHIVQTIQQDIKILFKRGMSAYGIGLFVWQFDLRYCELLQVWWPEWSGLPNPQFHAWWHVCVSTGFYFLITLSAYDRQITLRKIPTLRWWCFVVPYVDVQVQDKSS